MNVLLVSVDESEEVVILLTVDGVVVERVEIVLPEVVDPIVVVELSGGTVVVVVLSTCVVVDVVLTVALLVCDDINEVVVGALTVDEAVVELVEFVLEFPPKVVKLVLVVVLAGVVVELIAVDEVVGDLALEVEFEMLVLELVEDMDVG